ncbi:PTS fructose transporter subunit IIC [Virgibacillus pantothenticus]|uniref:PTS fructose transporter subunit IIC n=1 Tax=Virgibacillus TaxID=84406 RepID=UPI00090BDEB4|nr:MULTISPECIES: PTS fructose transporter subunit IIBC [Virgibacillus]API91984.1 PTS fructose transporter subunit IIC [Virgibacillus sp. 6R]MBS7430442.1 fructose-specific PTS transporter subunit EIIC [Virgibacillus sp. 19R1-5]MBU8566380.1 PTS fructose transporter subunit IIBC [Virgibacillus pantothenticus]MBU8600204.1 PTS fructose transporter subunit IIBC [Virgibacillus pantothenticus]MBU8633864.1 PTS fructose transporter subunit IIBC [Virgibacillus pantothenticus]
MTKKKIVAATGCPTGIAHTFMAAEALQKAAEKLNVEIKVETHGQVGIENALTPEEIKAADGVIIAADKDVQADRFHGKPVVDVPVSKGIKDPEGLIEQILQGKASIYYASGYEGTDEGEIVQDGAPEGNSRKWVHAIYKHLMNGVSHMLPFVVGGGVLIAISFLFGIYSADPKHEQYNEFAALLKEVGDLGFSLMVPILAAFIAESIAKRPGMVVGFIGGLLASQGGAGFLGGILAGFIAGYIIILLQKLLKGLPRSLDGLKSIFLYPVLGIFLIGIIMKPIIIPVTGLNEGLMDFLASVQSTNPLLLGLIVGAMCGFDMGGPFNKAAYVTGTLLLAEGNLYFMAGVSAACIAPPLIIAFATVLFPKYFTKEERNAGAVNFILGSTHITEGAIPFAAKNPIVVLPIIMLGSSIAAMLTYLFKVQVPAPHGGFLVLPVVTGAFQWVIAILIGSMVGALLYGMYRKKAAQK